MQEFENRKGGRSTTYALPFKKKDGTFIQVLMSPRAKFDANGVFRGSYSVVTDITSLKKIEDELKEREKALEQKTIELSEANAALKVLIRNREEDMRELEERVLTNVRQRVLPHLKRLKKYHTAERGLFHLKVLETNLNEIVSPLIRNLNRNGRGLTFMESQIASFIKDGMSTKEIAQMLRLSERTIEFHRNNLRKKMGLNKSRINLQTHLATLK
jgi:DNA-binding NarL/FixJ family response regulator